MSAELPKHIRKFLYEYLIEHGRAPHLEEVAAKFGTDRRAVVDAFDQLEQSRLLARLKGTERLLMLWPFSNLPTPFLVRVEGGRRYYANCAWDAVGIHVLLGAPAQVQSYCRHCVEPIELVLRDGTVQATSPETVLTHFSKPAARWWDDIVDTCGNNMNFFSSEAHLREWRVANPQKPGHTLSLEQLLALSRFIYSRGRLQLEYQRPSRDEFQHFFESVKLTGEFWRL